MMKSAIFDVIGSALTQAGYKILDRDGFSVIIRTPKRDAGYRITIAEEGECRQKCRDIGKQITGISLSALPVKPVEGKMFWTDGQMIFSKDEAAINGLADFFEAVDLETVCTGYCDPKEDEESGQMDMCTGHYYLNW